MNRYPTAQHYFDTISPTMLQRKHGGPRRLFLLPTTLRILPQARLTPAQSLLQTSPACSRHLRQRHSSAFHPLHRRLHRFHSNRQLRLGEPRACTRLDQRALPRTPVPAACTPRNSRRRGSTAHAVQRPWSFPYQPCAPQRHLDLPARRAPGLLQERADHRRPAAPSRHCARRLRAAPRSQSKASRACCSCCRLRCASDHGGVGRNGIAAAMAASMAASTGSVLTRSRLRPHNAPFREIPDIGLAASRSIAATIRERSDLVMRLSSSVALLLIRIE